MKTGIKYCLLITILLTGINLLAQNNNTELKTLINSSFTYYPKFKELQQSVIIGENKIAAINTNRNPVINANSSFTYLNPVNEFAFGANNVKINPNANYTVNIGGSYILYDFGAIKENVAKAKTELQSSRHNIDAAKAQIAYQIANVYYAIIYIKNAIQIQDTVLAFLYQNQKDIQIKTKLGVALEFDNLTIQATIDQELNRKADLENMQQKQLNLLQYLTGENAIRGNDFDFKNTTVNVLDFLAKAQTQNYDYVLQQDKIKTAEADNKIIALQNKPSLVVNAATGFRNGIAPTINDFRYNYVAGVGLQIPLYNGGKMKKNLKLNESIIKLQSITLNNLDSTFKKDYNEVTTDIATANKRIQNTASQITQAKAAKALAQIRFKNGIGTNLELLNANTNLQKAALAKLQYQYQLCLANVELARLSGEKVW
jgi:outer membrane protein